MQSRPDSIRRYSDLGFITLGKVIETVSETTIIEAATEFVFHPMGMHTTSFADPRNVAVCTSRGDRFEFDMLRTQIPYKLEERPEDFSLWRTDILRGQVNDGNAFHLFVSGVYF